MSGDLKGFLQAGYDIMQTTVNAVTSKILVQLGNVVGQTTDTDSAEYWQHVGFASRPSKPEAGKSAAQAVVLRKGDHDICIASQDLRGLELYGKLDHGETAIYAPGPDGTAQARVLLKKDGSINLYTTDSNDADGTSVYFRVAVDGFTFNSPWGVLKFDSTGFHVIHSSGASFDLGGIYGLPFPLDQAGSYVRMQAGTISTSTVAQAFGAGAPNPLAGSIGVLAAIAALQAEIVAIAGAVTAIGAIPAVTGGVAAAAPAAAGVATGVSAIAAANLLIPASTSST